MYIYMCKYIYVYIYMYIYVCYVYIYIYVCVRVCCVTYKMTFVYLRSGVSSKIAFQAGKWWSTTGFGGTDFEINPNRKINADEKKQHVERLILVGHFASYF